MTKTDDRWQLTRSRTRENSGVLLVFRGSAGLRVSCSSVKGGTCLMKKYLEDRGKLAPAYTEVIQIKCVEIWLTGQKLPSPLRKSLLLEAMAGHPDNCCWIPRLIKRESVRMLSFRQQLSWNKPWRYSPVSGGISASVTISPSSTDVSTWGSGLGFSAGSKVRSRPSVVVLVGVSSSCSMASCFTISSASTACPGESEPAVPGGQEWDEIREISEWTKMWQF